MCALTHEVPSEAISQSVWVVDHESTRHSLSWDPGTAQHSSSEPQNLVRDDSGQGRMSVVSSCLLEKFEIIDI